MGLRELKLSQNLRGKNEGSVYEKSVSFCHHLEEGCFHFLWCLIPKTQFNEVDLHFCPLLACVCQNTGNWKVNTHGTFLLSQALSNLARVKDFLKENQ